MKTASIMSSVCAAAFLFCAPANAADAIIGESYTLVPAPVMDMSADKFCDAYAGVQAGYLWGNTEYSGDFATSFTNFFALGKNNGVTGGLYAGCNFRQGSFLWGVEGDINLAGTGLSEHQDWYGTLRGRVGSTFGNTLLFATGGLAFGQFDMISKGDPSMAMSMTVKTPTAIGWTVGAGIEHWFSDKISWKMEYLYVDLGKVGTLHYNNDNSEVLRADYTAHTIRTGISIHF